MSPLDGKLAPQPKQPPYSMEAEMSVLGGLLLNNRAIEDVAAVLREDDFYNQDHRLIFRGIGALAAQRKPVDFVTLSEHFRLAGNIEEVGGAHYLMTLAADTGSAANVRAHAEVVRERSTLRALIAAGADIASMGYQPDGRSTAELLADLQRIVASLETRGPADTAETFGAAATAALEQIGRAQAERKAGRTPGVPYGLSLLDRATGGMRPGELVGVCARTSIGKTAFALQAAVRAGMQRRRGLLITLEESGAAMAMRAIANEGEVNLSAMRGGNPEAVDKAHDAVVQRNLTELPLWIDSKTFDLPTIRARIARFVRRERIEFAIIDHVGLVSVPAMGRKRYEQLGDVTRALKHDAEILGIAIMPLVQVGRDAAKAGRRPALFDLRESGNIEQDLSVCIALHDPAGESEQTKPEVVLEVGLLKNRYGMKGWLSEKLRFVGAYQRFEQETSNVSPDVAEHFDGLPPPHDHWADR